MLSQADNDILTRTDPDTHMGSLFRRFWIPVLLAEEVVVPDGPQVRVKVMGEELLAFRDTEGRVGLIEPRCPHRGANLFFGRNEQCGIRCAFHGWKFNALGECVDIPILEPAVAAGMKEKAGIKAYRACEWGGMIWAYVGPRDPQSTLPPMPEMEFALLPASHRHVSKKLQECNWAQAAEGALDTAHFSFLHQPVAQTDAELQEKSARAEVRATQSFHYSRCPRYDPS